MKHGTLPIALAMACLAALFIGCSSYKLREVSSPALPPFGKAPESAARICMVRTSWNAKLVTFLARDNGQLVGATRGAGHFCYLAEPGHHEIAIEADQTATASIRAEAGRSYYLHQEVDNILGVVQCRPIWVDEAMAQELFAHTPYSVLAGVPGDERLPEQPPYVRARP